MQDETCDRVAAFRAAMAQRDGDPSMSGLKREPQNNRSPYSTYGNANANAKNKDVRWWSKTKGPQFGRLVSASAGFQTCPVPSPHYCMWFRKVE